MYVTCETRFRGTLDVHSLFKVWWTICATSSSLIFAQSIVLSRGKPWCVLGVPFYYVTLHNHASVKVYMSSTALRYFSGGKLTRLCGKIFTRGRSRRILCGRRKTADPFSRTPSCKRHIRHCSLRRSYSHFVRRLLCDSFTNLGRCPKILRIDPRIG